MATQSPTTTLRDGALKATAWRNSGSKGDYFTVRLSRSYRDDNDKWHDSDRFRRNELLAAAHLLTRAYDELVKLAAEARVDTASNTPDDGRHV